LANPEHLAKLKEGVEPWNRWRKENPVVQPDLTEANFYQADLNGADLHGAFLDGANLYMAHLRGADVRAYLRKAVHQIRRPSDRDQGHSSAFVTVACGAVRQD
jgi:hypothetical protein